MYCSRKLPLLSGVTVCSCTMILIMRGGQVNYHDLASRVISNAIELNYLSRFDAYAPLKKQIF
jgi:hypothetical protein